MATAGLKRFHAGEVYVTENLSIILECKSCDERFGVYAQFLNHILGKHFDDWTATDKNVSIDQLKAKEPEEFIANNEQQFGIESTQSEKYASVDELITEILQPMGYDEANTIDGRNAEEPENSATEISPQNVRPDPAKQKERKHKCKLCSATFTLISNLRLHEQRHTKIKPFACLKCDKAFYTSTNLNNHLRRHNGEKPYICTYCGVSFGTSTALRSHERRHTNDRRFKCNECEKRFFDSKQLRRHMVVHTKERNFTCEECSSTFTQKMALQTHMKLHANALEYQCIICNMRFNQRPTLQLHMKRKHDVLDVTNPNKRPSRTLSS